jgi:hypothetical protein
MIYRERLRQAMVAGAEIIPDEMQTDLDKLILYAYYQGKTDGVREVCHIHTKQIKRAKEQAKVLRYHRMAERALPDEVIYHADYAGDYPETFGSDEWKGE